MGRDLAERYDDAERWALESRSPRWPGPDLDQRNENDGRPSGD